MTLEPTDDNSKPNKKQSYAVMRRARIKRKNQMRRKAALEEKKRMYGTLSDLDRGRLKELQDTCD